MLIYSQQYFANKRFRMRLFENIYRQIVRAGVQAARMFSVVFCYSRFGYKLAASIRVCQFHKRIHMQLPLLLLYTVHSTTYRVRTTLIPTKLWTFQINHGNLELVNIWNHISTEIWIFYWSEHWIGVAWSNETCLWSSFEIYDG